MAMHWAMVMLAWLAGIAVQLNQTQIQAGLGHWGLVMGVMGVVPVLVWRFWQACRAALLAWVRARAGLAAHRWTQRWLGVWLACVAAACLAWSQTQWRAQRLAQEVWPAQEQAVKEQPVQLIGQVAEMPGKQPWGWTVKVKVHSWQVGERHWAAGQFWGLPGQAADQVAPRWVSLVMSAQMPEPVPGEVWRWPVRMGQAQGPSNPGGFDLDLWLWEQGIRAVGQVDEKRSDPVRLAGVRPWSPGVVERWRTRLRQNILAAGMDERASGMVRGLTIGEQGAIAMADWEAMRLTGTAHLAAISGLHITLMGAIAGGVMGWLWRRSTRLMMLCPAPTVVRWGGLVAAVLYALLAGWGVPAQRTVWMLLVVVVLRSSGRRWPWPLTLLLAAVAVTALDPWALVSAGFWLSFVAVGVLMWGGADTLEVPGSGRWAQWRHAAGELWRTQRLASIGLAPLSLVFFQAVSWIGLGVNLVCIPWFTAVLTPLAMLGLCFNGFWRLLEPLMLFTLDALHEAAQVPWAQWQVPAVNAWAAALAVLGGAWLLAPLSWRWRLWALPCLLPLLWSTSWTQTLPFPARGEVDVMAADVGQGSAVLIRTARHALLFDTGPISRSGDDAGRRVLVGLMRALGVQRLDELLLSHGDADHTGGAASVLKALPVLNLRSSVPPDDVLRHTPDALRHMPDQVSCQAGQGWDWDGVRFDIVHPLQAIRSEGETRRDNEMSCVLRVRAHGRQVLITGDVEAAQEAELVAREGPEGLASEVLLVPHHGSRTSSTPDFLDAVQPQVAVVQVGARNAYGHPHPKVMARYAAKGVPTVTTPACGAWHWQSSRQPTGVGQCWKDARRRYWHPLP
jgi:competence protein ComEC